jgi:alcohol dehydrogenase class IV
MTLTSTPFLSVNFPGKLVFGNGCLSALPGEITNTGCSSAFIITIEPLIARLEDFIASLKSNGINVAINTGIVQEPTFSDLENLLIEAKAANPDVVIGIGGGSVLDIAKLVAAQLDNDQTLYQIVGNGLLKGRNIKLVCVPP